MPNLTEWISAHRAISQSNRNLCPRRRQIMCLALRSALAFSVFLLIPATLSAQHLSQPASVLPWAAPKLESVKPLPSSTAIPEVTQELPAWLSTSTPKAAPKAPQKSRLPMVEKQHYANLGNIPTNGAQATTRPVTARSKPLTRSAQAVPPLKFLRTIR